MRVKVRIDRATTELCRSRLRSLYRTLHKKDRAVSLIRDIVENTEAFIRKVQESDSVLNNTIEPYPDLNYVQQLKKFAVSCYWDRLGKGGRHDILGSVNFRFAGLF